MKRLVSEEKDWVGQDSPIRVRRWGNGATGMIRVVQGSYLGLEGVVRWESPRLEFGRNGHWVPILFVRTPDSFIRAVHEALAQYAELASVEGEPVQQQSSEGES